MANNDSLTEIDHNIVHRSFKLPRIKVPKVFGEGDWGRLSFKIETTHGTIKVTSGYRKRWECRGDVHSLVAAGFIESNWCPGLPGNNITRQTVLFENNNPRLVYGNRRGTTLPATNIVIIRVSKNKFVVEVPATKEQSELMEQAQERWHQRWRDEEALKEQQEKLKQKQEKRKQKYSNPALFKDDPIFALNMGLKMALNYLTGENEFFEYGERTM